MGLAGVAQGIGAAACAGVKLRAFANDDASRLARAYAFPFQRPQLRFGDIGVTGVHRVGELFDHADVLVREALLDEGSIISGQVDARLAVLGGIAGVAVEIVHLLGRGRGLVYGVGQILGAA